MIKAVPRLRSSAAITSALILAAIPITAQEPSLPELFSDTIDVRIVNVEVVVTDKKGNRIRGLEPDDFELLVDRQPVPIAYFTEVDEGYARTAGGDGVADVPALTHDEPVGTNYLIFVDDLSAVRGRRDRVLSRLDQDLHLLNPADRAAIVAFDGEGVSRLTDWTNSQYQLRSALLAARMRPAFGRRGVEATRRAVMAATATMQSVARGPGRNVMLLLADSWSAPSAVWDVLRSGLSRPSVESLYSPLVHAANRVGYSLYPVDVAGLQHGPRSYWQPLPRVPGGYYTYVTGDSRGSTIYPPPWPSMQMVMAGSYEQRQHDVFRFLADETGGRPMLNAFRSKALSETVADTRSYYWLGFDAPQSRDDELHDIRVRLVGHKKLRARSREHYLDMSKDTEIGMRLEASMLFGTTPGADTLDVRLGTPTKAGFRRISVPVEVVIPLDELTLLPMDGQWVNELEFRISAVDKWDILSRKLVRKVPVVRPEAPAPGETFVYETDLRLRKREYRYVAAVYDPLTDRMLVSARGVVSPRGDRP
ncbi:MAG: VWA domain-containing protein [Holophagales bacterium]|nr:VWA domain-containing protein [Holophagales bacterium]MYD21767.1 VWA domain-containing protein [Holophagales bacterium]MYI32036.1 VWA domain-containing protein [Holophagales bacterium]